MAAEYNFKYFNVSFPRQYVAHVEINRPEKRNAFVRAMWLEMQSVFDTLSHDPRVRCVVLSGAGEQAFCSGLDVQEATKGPLLNAGGDQAGDSARRATLLRRDILEFQSCISAIEKCEKPVIALLHGFAFGLAIDIALAADIRLCSSGCGNADTLISSSSPSPSPVPSSSSSAYKSPATSFSVKEVDIGLAADIGTLSRLPLAGVSQSWAKEICFTARTFGAAEALRVGLVSGVQAGKRELVAEGMRLATEIAGKSPVAVQGTKEIMNIARDHGVQESLKYTAVWNSAMLQTEDVKRSLVAITQKRVPTYENL